MSLALPVLTPVEARSLGVFVDAAEEAGFLYARRQPALGAGLTRTDGGRPDASVFSISATVPVRSHVMVRVVQPFIALVGAGETETGFGDATVHARVDIATGDGRALRLLSSVQIGTGTSELFPYSTQSIDLGLGLGYVDSVGALYGWARLDGVAVKRAPDGLDGATRHEDSVRFGAGVGVDVAGRIALRGGATVHAFRSGGRRDAVFSQVGYAHTPALEVFAGAAFEVGDGADRVGDMAVTAGLHTHF